MVVKISQNQNRIHNFNVIIIIFYFLFFHQGTDYISNYFDPGEDYIDEDDGGDDGPTY